MSRQHAVPSRSRHRSPKSAVWIDPAVSTYLQGEQIEQSSPSLSPPVEPPTPIPPRASAQRLRAVKVRPRYAYSRVQVSEESDLAEVPTVPPPTTWQYDSQAYTAESSISTLSLIMDTPTRPETPTPNRSDRPVMPTMPETPPHGMPRIEEVATRPPAIGVSKSTVHGIVDSTINEPSRAIEEQNTMPMQLSPAAMPAAQLPTAASLFLGAPVVASPAFAPVAPAAVQTVPTVLPPQSRQRASAELVSWTAGNGAGSRYAQLVAARTSRQKSRTSFNIVDRVRWWLLHPGRFEFLMWLSGTLLLVAVTCILILMSAFSFQWNGANANNGATSAFNGTNGPTNGQNSSPGLSLTLTNADPLLVGQSLRVHGQGFSANGHIALTYDAGKSFLNQKGQSLVVQADAHGAFAVTLASPAWGTGQHRIVARDLATGHLATVSVTVVASAKVVTATSAVTTPATTATPTQQGNNPPPVPPVGQTPPALPTATVGITPTTTPRPLTPTPTIGITATATVGTTPTVGVTATPKLGETATVGTTATVGVTATVGNANPAVLNTQDVAASGEPAVSGGPWLWLLLGGYALAMLLFGLAGLVHNVHRRL